MAVYFDAWSKFARFTGRSSRSEYWWFVFINTCIYVVLGLLTVNQERKTPGDGANAIQGLFSLLVIIPTVAVSVRRLHDIDRSGWWALLMIFGCFGGIVLFFFYIKEGDIGENQYGPDPYENESSAPIDYRMIPIGEPDPAMRQSVPATGLAPPRGLDRQRELSAENNYPEVESLSSPPAPIVGRAYLKEPRPQHYAFAHLFLRDKAFANPVATVNELSREKGTQYLKILWSTIGHKNKGKNDNFIPPDGLACHPIRVGDRHRGVIVKMPEPLGPAEAYFIAIVIPADALPVERCLCRYYTLELSANWPSETVFCEWTAGAHMNRGSGVPPILDAFKALVRNDFTNA